MLLAVSERFFWEVRRALNRSSGKVRYQKTRSTGRKYNVASEHHF